ncbi:MAG: hypothetical protein ACJ8GJ_22430 [Vitreoscilla sp.]
MEFLDWLLGAPTLDKLARDVTRELHELGAQELRVDLVLREMTFRLHGGQMKLYLGNVLQDLRCSRRAARPALLKRFLDGMLSPEDSLPATYEDVRPRLMPVVRRRDDMGIVALAALGATDDPARRFQPATKPLAGDLVIALVRDQPTSMAYVNERELPAWHVTFDQALDDALDNLRGLPEHGGWQQIGPGVWSGEWGDSYDSSRILLPDLIHRVGVRDPVAAVPFRNALMLTSAGNEAGIALMARVIEEHVDDRQRWLSFQLLRLDNTQWRVHAPLVAVDAWHLLNLRNAAAVNESQKELLDTLHARRGLDLFVASYQMMARDDLGALSFSVWAEQVDTLLPHTEFIVFHQCDRDAAGPLLVPWAEASAVVGELMEATEHAPERFRVRRFPDAAQLARLEELAIAP